MIIDNLLSYKVAHSDVEHGASVLKDALDTFPIRDGGISKFGIEYTLAYNVDKDRMLLVWCLNDTLYYTIKHYNNSSESVNIFIDLCIKGDIDPFATYEKIHTRKCLTGKQKIIAYNSIRKLILDN